MKLRNPRSLVLVIVAVVALAQAVTAGAASFSNPTPLTRATDEGPMTLYPSPITPTGLAGSVSHVKVSLNTFQWGHSADVDVLLVAPNGAAVVLMSDACTFFSGPTTPATLTFDDNHVLVLPPSGCASIPINTKPFNNADALACDADPDVWPSPAPAGPPMTGYAPGPQLMSTFNGMSAATAMGEWKLFVNDDCDSLTTPDTGLIAGGWTLEITTAPSTAVTMLSFTARALRAGVELRWRTASEADLAGFNVYREQNGKRTKVNRSLIASKGRGGYTFVDRAVAKRKAVRYWIQTVSLDGSRRWYGPAVM